MKACVALDVAVVDAFAPGPCGGLGLRLGWLVGFNSEIHRYLANDVGVVLWMQKGWS